MVKVARKGLKMLLQSNQCINSRGCHQMHRAVKTKLLGRKQSCLRRWSQVCRSASAKKWELHRLQDRQ